jgi:hypothetical protein
VPLPIYIYIYIYIQPIPSREENALLPSCPLPRKGKRQGEDACRSAFAKGHRKKADRQARKRVTRRDRRRRPRGSTHAEDEDAQVRQRADGHGGRRSVSICGALPAANGRSGPCRSKNGRTKYWSNKIHGQIKFDECRVIADREPSPVALELLAEGDVVLLHLRRDRGRGDAASRRQCGRHAEGAPRDAVQGVVRVVAGMAAACGVRRAIVAGMRRGGATAGDALALPVECEYALAGEVLSGLEAQRDSRPCSMALAEQEFPLRCPLFHSCFVLRDNLMEPAAPFTFDSC